jgi:hypothetical protein
VSEDHETPADEGVWCLPRVPSTSVNIDSTQLAGPLHRARYGKRTPTYAAGPSSTCSNAGPTSASTSVVCIARLCLPNAAREAARVPVQAT